MFYFIRGTFSASCLFWLMACQNNDKGSNVSSTGTYDYSVVPRVLCTELAADASIVPNGPIGKNQDYLKEVCEIKRALVAFLGKSQSTYPRFTDTINSSFNDIRVTLANGKSDVYPWMIHYEQNASDTTLANGLIALVPFSGLLPEQQQAFQALYNKVAALDPTPSKLFGVDGLYRMLFHRMVLVQVLLSHQFAQTLKTQGMTPAQEYAVKSKVAVDFFADYAATQANQSNLFAPDAMKTNLAGVSTYIKLHILYMIQAADSLRTEPSAQRFAAVNGLVDSESQTFNTLHGYKLFANFDDSKKQRVFSNVGGLPINHFHGFHSYASYRLRLLSSKIP